MKTYIGTKVVLAEREDREDEDEIVKHGYKIIYEDGYESWSPIEVFERCYREITVNESLLMLPVQKMKKWGDNEKD